MNEVESLYVHVTLSVGRHEATPTYIGKCYDVCRLKWKFTIIILIVNHEVTWIKVRSNGINAHQLACAFS